jgi:hypothetical protein
MKKLQWFERQFTFGLPQGMLPFYLERLEGSIARVEKKLSSAYDEALSHKLDGKWSAKENIAHLAEVDEIALKRLDEMVQGISPMSPAVIQPGRDYNSMSVREIADLFRANRLKNLEKYKSLSERDLDQQSLHPRLKVMMSPVDLAWFDAEHDDHHLARVTEILAVLNK